MPGQRSDNFFDHRKRSVSARRKDRIFLISLLVMSLLMIAGTGAFLLVQWLNQSEADPFGSIKSWAIWQSIGIVEPQVALPPAPIPLIDVPIYPQDWQRQIYRKPRAVCAVIKNLGFTIEGWQRSPGGWDGWECLGEMKIAAGDETRASMFFSMRGEEEDSIDNLRLKFNLPPENQGRKAYANLLANSSLVPLFDFFHWTFPNDIKEKILDLTPFETVMDGVSVRLFEDFQTNRRVNLLMWLPEEKFPFEIVSGRTLMHFVDFEKEPARKVTQLRTANKTQSATIDWHPLMQDEEGALLPQEPGATDADLIEPTELSSDDADLILVEEPDDAATTPEGLEDEEGGVPKAQPSSHEEKLAATEAIEDKSEGPLQPETPLRKPGQATEEPSPQTVLLSRMPLPKPSEAVQELTSEPSPTETLQDEDVQRMPVTVNTELNAGAFPSGLLDATSGLTGNTKPAQFHFEQSGKKLYSRFSVEKNK